MADSELTDLTEDTAPATTNLLYTVRDPAGAPVDRKLSLATLLRLIPGTVIAQTAYRPSANGTTTTTSTSFADLDTTNLTITFTAPLTGNVNVILECLVSPPNGGSMHWGIRDTTPTLIASQYIGFSAGLDTLLHRASATFPVTGLTPGTSYTYRWAGKVNAGTGTLYRGNDGGGTNPYGTALMQVEVAA